MSFDVIVGTSAGKIKTCFALFWMHHLVVWFSAAFKPSCCSIRNVIPKFVVTDSTSESAPTMMVLLTLECFNAPKTSSSMARVKRVRSLEVRTVESLVFDFESFFTGTIA